MNFSKIAVAALSFTYSPRFVQGEEIKHKVGPWELHAIGNDVEGTRFGTVTADMDAVTIKLHVEGSFDDEPTIEVFSGVSDSKPCATGTMISEVAPSFDSLSSSPLNELRVTSDGAIGLVTIRMSLHNDSAWTAINEDNTDVGTFNACVRVTKKHDGNYVSFVDSSIKLNVNAEGKFQTFENAITVVGTSMKSLEENQTKEIGMDSYLCGPSDSGNPERPYKIGQSFSICVGPTEVEKNNYDYIAVVGFEDVTCAKTIKVVEDGQAKALTTVTTNPKNYKKAGEGIVGSGVSSFETVVTPEYYTPNEASVTCSGTVELSFTNPNPPSTRKYVKEGCIPFMEGAELMYYTGYEVTDMDSCHDTCRGWGFSYFVPMCPYRDGWFECYCAKDSVSVEVSSETCSASLTSNRNKVAGCALENVGNSAYEFGALLDIILNVAVYKVVPNERPLTYAKAGCAKQEGDSKTFVFNGGTLDDVTQCNDYCSGKSEYFLLDCPFYDGWGIGDYAFQCICTSADDLEVTSETCSGSKTADDICISGLAENSAYEFGMGESTDLKLPAYKVTTRRRLTASFSTNSGDLLQRHLQESGDTSGSFGTEVLLSREDNAVFGDLVAAPAADTGAVPSTVMASAARALVVAAAAALA